MASYLPASTTDSPYGDSFSARLPQMSSDFRQNQIIEQLKKENVVLKDKCKKQEVYYFLRKIFYKFYFFKFKPGIFTKITNNSWRIGKATGRIN